MRAFVALVALAAAAAGLATPRTRWATSVPAVDGFGDPVVGRGLVFQGGTLANKANASLVAIDAVTGIPRWSAEEAGGGKYVAVSESTRLVVFGTTLGVVAFDMDSGNVAWRFDASRVPRSQTRALPGKPTVLAGENLVVVTWYNTPLVALELTTGKYRYQTPFVTTNHIFAVKERLYTARLHADGNSSVVCLSGRDGALRWERMYNKLFGGIAVNEYALGVQFFDAAGNAYLDSLALESGALHWHRASKTAFDFNVGPGVVLQAHSGALPTDHWMAIGINPVSGRTLFNTTVGVADASTNAVSFPHSDVFFLECYTTGHTYAVDINNGALLWGKASPLPMYGVVYGNTYFYGYGKNAVAAVQLRPSP